MNLTDIAAVVIPSVIFSQDTPLSDGVFYELSVA